MTHLHSSYLALCCLFLFSSLSAQKDSLFVDSLLQVGTDLYYDGAHQEAQVALLKGLENARQVYEAPHPTLADLLLRLGKMSVKCAIMI